MYLTKEDLISRIQEIEWDDFEAKAAKSELPKNTWDTVSSFSNTSGGWILFGVAQHGKKFEIEGYVKGGSIEKAGGAGTVTHSPCKDLTASHFIPTFAT